MFGRHIVRVDDVLHPERHAAQHADTRAVVDLASLGEGLLGVCMREGLNLRLAFGDAFQMRRGDSFGAGLSQGNGGG